MTDVVAAGDVHQGFALVPSRACFLLLVRRQLEFRPELPASSFSSRASLAGPGAYEFPLEFGKTGKHGQHQSTVRSRGVGPCVSERAEACFLLRNQRQRIEQIAGAAGQTVKPCD